MWPRVRVFRINTSSGALTEVPGSPFLTGQYYFQFATPPAVACS